MLTPATYPRMGTPASARASEAPQTAAMADEPLDASVSAFKRTVKAKSSFSGMTGASAVRMKALWLTSLRLPPPSARLTCDRGSQVEIEMRLLRSRGMQEGPSCLQL